MENGNKIRKQWLVAFCLYGISSILFQGIRIISGVATGTIRPFFGLAVFFLALVVLAVVYHCAYKKRGTKLLAFQLITGSLFSTFSFIKVVVAATQTLVNLGIKSELVSAVIIGFFILDLPFLAAHIFYLFSSYRLYRLNKSLKQRSFRDQDQVGFGQNKF